MVSPSSVHLWFRITNIQSLSVFEMRCSVVSSLVTIAANIRWAWFK